VSSKKIVLPSSFFGPIKYYSILFNNKNCIIDVYENYIKQSIRSRCDLYSSNGKLSISVPKIRKNSSKTRMKDIQICYSEDWQKSHWKTLLSCYNSSPFFDFYKEKIEIIFQKKEKFLIDLNLKSLEIIKDFLKIDRDVVFSKEYINKTECIDLRLKKFLSSELISYDQVFSKHCGFINNLSILDLIFNLGPEAINIINDKENIKI